jgi:hypothetical protein
MIRRTIFDVDYDSHLGYPNGSNTTEFNLIIKVFLTRLNPHDGHKFQKIYDEFEDKKIKYQAWTDAEWATFKEDFKSDTNKYLNWPNLHLYLLPWAEYKSKTAKIQLDYFRHPHPTRNSTTPYVNCGTSVLLVADKSKAHVSFQVIREKDGEPGYRSYDHLNPGGQDYGILTNRDIDRWATPPSDGIPQNGAFHELGHVLGLRHINLHDPHCHRQNQACYGKPGTPQYSDWMGSGNHVSAADASPWLRRIPKHAHGLNWQIATKRPDEIDL